MKEKHVIEIVIISGEDDEIGFDNSLDEAVKKIKDGCYSGMDGNEDEEYTFFVKKDEDYEE